MTSLDDKLNNMNHPVTKMLAAIHGKGEQSNSQDIQGFKGKMIRALLKSQSKEHYEALYAMWDEAPFKEASRMIIKLIYQIISVD
jgi:hypothetical protein